MIAPLGSKHEIAVVWWQQQHHLLELYFSTYVINIYLENSQHSKIRIKVQFVEIALITFKYLKINILWRFIEPSSSDEPYRLKKEFSKNVEFRGGTFLRKFKEIKEMQEIKNSLKPGITF